jgi:hypothetical protein
VAERLASCGVGCNVVRRTIWGDYTSYHFVGTLAVNPGAFAMADALGELPHLKIIREVRELANGSWVLEVSVPLDGRSEKDLLTQLQTAALNLKLDADIAVVEPIVDAFMQPIDPEDAAGQDIPF